MNESINKLIEINDILLIYNNHLFEKDKTNLKKEFNKILNSLRKSLFNNKWNEVFKTPQDIIDYSVKYCKFKEDFATNKTRHRDDYVYTRQMIQTICRYVFKNRSLSYIGNFFVNSDHATVLHSIKTVNNLCETDKRFKERFNDVQINVLGDIYIK